MFAPEPRNPYPLRVDVPTRLEIVDGRAGGNLDLGEQRHTAEPERLTDAGMVDNQHRDAAQVQLLHDAPQGPEATGKAGHRGPGRAAFRERASSHAALAPRPSGLGA